MIIAIPQTFMLTVSPTYSRIAVLAPIVDCPSIPYPPFISSIADGYNCNRCGSDPVYYMRYRIGDTIPLQLTLPDLKSTDVVNPSMGWLSSATAGNTYYIKAEVLDFDCTTVIYSLVDSFCTDYWVTFDPIIGSIQTLFIDTNSLPVGTQVFRLRFTWYTSSHTVAGTVYSEPFMLENPCENTLLFRGDNSSKDCLRRVYYEPTAFYHEGVNPFGYSPRAFWAQMRYQADIVEVGYTNEKTLNDNDVLINQKTSKNFEFRFYPMPPYAAELLNAIITSEVVTIESEQYTNFSDVEKRIEGGITFAPILTASQICTINNKGCE